MLEISRFIPISETKNKIRVLAGQVLYNTPEPIQVQRDGGSHTKQEVDYVNKVANRVWKKIYEQLREVGEM